MLIVTGGAGFIGSNLIAALNARGEDDILLVDNLTNADKLANIADLDVSDYVYKKDFLYLLDEWVDSASVKAVFHLGACSDTMEQDGNYMMENNYTFSRALVDWCVEHTIPFIYASSAAVYGAGTTFVEQRSFERPLNIYGYSKFLFDQYVRRVSATKSQIVGLRYFNVYGPREGHKGRMASVAWHHYHQLQHDGYVSLFEGSHGYANGAQSRDFIYVGDAVAAKLHFLDNPQTSGIFNLGTGQAQSFNALALAGVNAWRSSQGHRHMSLSEAQNEGLIRYKAFPEGLVQRYQAFTQADVSRLRSSGFSQDMCNVEQGVGAYFAWLNQEQALGLRT